MPTVAGQRINAIDERLSLVRQRWSVSITLKHALKLGKARCTGLLVKPQNPGQKHRIGKPRAACCSAR